MNPFAKPENLTEVPKPVIKKNRRGQLNLRSIMKRKLPRLLKNKRYKEVTNLLIDTIDAVDFSIMMKNIDNDILNSNVNAILNSLCPTVRKMICRELIENEELPKELIEQEKKLLKNIINMENDDIDENIKDTKTSIH